jgi:DNA-binding IclR family transcriptional regulator
MARRGITTERALEVLAVFRQGDLSYREACERLHIGSNNALYRHVRNLEARGLIEREPRKRRSIKVLAAGIAALDDA